MELIPQYLARKAGTEPIEYEHQLLEPICSETYGIMIYQEQVMQAAQALAGYTLGKADLLRRAMGKKKPEEMAAQHDVFVEGCAEVQQDSRAEGREDLRPAGQVRRVRVQQVARRRLRLPVVHHRLPEGQFPGRVHRRDPDQ